MDYFTCADCGNRIILFATKALGKRYCYACYDKFKASAPCSDFPRGTKQMGRYVNLNDVYTFGNDWRIVFNKRNTFHKVVLHKLFQNGRKDDIVALNTANGIPMLVSSWYDGGPDGDGDCLTYERITYETLHQIILKKGPPVSEVFRDLNENNWRDYLDKTC